MLIHNTSNIDDAVFISVLKLTQLPNTTIEKLTIRNKKATIGHGILGYYDRQTRNISLIIPLSVYFPYTHHLTYIKEVIAYESKLDYIFAILAHECRHVYQFQCESFFGYDTKLKRRVAEFDAELYQYQRYQWWKNQHSRSTRKVASHS